LHFFYPHHLAASASIACLKVGKSALWRAFSPTANCWPPGGAQHVVLLWDLKPTVKSELTGHTGRTARPGFSPDGKTPPPGLDKTVSPWSVSTG